MMHHILALFIFMSIEQRQRARICLILFYFAEAFKRNAL